MKKLLVTIAGPTAVGKTNVSIHVAKHFHTEIISADARQFYREMNIGVAKPSAEELAQVPHHFIGHLSIQQSYSAGDFEKDVLEKLEMLFIHHDLVVMTGGSGLFINAVLQGLDSFPETTKEAAASLKELYQREGIEGLQKLLKKLDPEYFNEVDQNNPHRLLRALSVCLSSGSSYSSFRKFNNKDRSFSAVIIGLQLDREMLYRSIDERVEDMMRKGLLEEAQSLMPFQDHTALQTVGYRELFDYLNRQMTLEEAVALIQQHTRNYAKRQMTWFRKQKNINWFHPNEVGAIIEFIQSRISEQAQV